MDSVAAGLAHRLLEELIRDAGRSSHAATHLPAGRRLCSRTEVNDDVRTGAIREAITRLRDAEVSGAYVNGVLPDVLRQMVEMQPPLDEPDLVQLLAIEGRWYPNKTYGISPHLITLAETLAARQQLADGTRAALANLRARLADLKPATDARRLAKRLDPLLGRPELLIDERDEWAAAIAAELRSMAPERRESWLAWVAGRQTGAAVKSSVALLGHSAVRDQLVGWFSRVRVPSRPADAGEFWFPPPSFAMKDANARILGALVLGAAHVADPVVARALGDLAAVCFTKIPDLGAYSQRVGNACVRALGTMDCREAVPELSRLASRLKYVVAKRLVQRALQTAAERSGTTVEDLQEDSVPDYGLGPDGLRRESLANGTVELSIADSPVQVRWVDERGRVHRGVPARIARTHPGEILQLRKAAKDLERQLATQCARLERVMALDRAVPIADWRRRYLEHPVLAALGRALIWEFGGLTATVRQGSLLDAEGRALSPPPNALVRLWHPIRSPREEVLAWQRFIERERVTQPFAQAHRETYASTQEPPGARRCAMFAGHYLREWVLASLCRERGWRYALQIADPGGSPTLALPGHRLQAQFTVAGTNEWNDQYESLISGDVVFNRDRGGPLPLADVPPVVLSEVLRDVDLFVTRASVRGAREPAPEAKRTREYWQEWSYGALMGETDRQRALTLQSLLATLDFGQHCAMSGSFLHVDAGHRRYRIHVGTGVVLVDDQVLEIDKAALRKSATVVWLPFRGDAVLADILTKARHLTRPSS